MNDYKETAERTGFDSGGSDAAEYQGPDLAGRRPIIVGSGTVTSEVVESSTDSGADHG